MLCLVATAALLATGAGLRLSDSGSGSGVGSGSDVDSDSPVWVPRKKITGPEHRRCGFRERRKTDVIGGTIVHDPSAFPFLAWIGDNDGTRLSQFCGGTLVSPRIVLTAGHCLYNSDQKNAKMWVRLRVADFSRSDGVSRSVVNWVRHPDFSTATLQNDLTLLLLNESVPASLAKPVHLSDGKMSFERMGNKTVVGWGSLDEQCRFYDTLLRKASVPMGTDGPECSTKGSKTLSRRNDFDAATQLCAGDYHGKMHYPGCGDSGGPLLAQEHGSWFQMGMVSWSYGVPYPDVFTRISHFRSWIETAAQSLSHAGLHPAVQALQTQTPPAQTHKA